MQGRLRLPKIPAEISRVELLQRLDAETHQPKVYLVVDFARPFFGWFILGVGVWMMATVVCIVEERRGNPSNPKGPGGLESV